MSDWFYTEQPGGFQGIVCFKNFSRMSLDVLCFEDMYLSLLKQVSYFYIVPTNSTAFKFYNPNSPIWIFPLLPQELESNQRQNTSRLQFYMYLAQSVVFKIPQTPKPCSNKFTQPKFGPTPISNWRYQNALHCNTTFFKSIVIACDVSKVVSTLTLCE
jgi:hypothetical protein